MSEPRFIDLFAWEWRRVGRTPLLWAILLALGASFLWGALNTAQLHQAQVQAQLRTRMAEVAHRATVEARAAAYHAPVTPDAPEVPYWQDPTNVSGFSQYFVYQHALKPHLPLSPLAAGVSDIAPGRLEVKINTLFGVDESYDFENPRGLALGRFDLAFALVYLLPVALILLFGLLVTVERDRGMLRLVAAQSTGPQLWLGARGAAILVWAAPIVLISLLAALAMAGAAITAALPELVAALMLVLAYMLFWSGLALLVLARFPGSAAALGMLAAIWATLTIGVPLLGAAFVSTLSPPPSAIAYIDAQRRIGDAIQADRDAIMKRAVAARPDLEGAESRLDTIDHATRLTFLVPETERRLAPLRSAIMAHREQQAGIAAIAGYLVPSLGLEATLAVLAGTGDERHHQFEAQARAYQLRLRAILYPRVQHEIAAPTPRAVPATRGRFSLIDRDILPAFAMTDRPASARVTAILPFAIWLLLLGGGLIALGLHRARAWPRDL